MYSTATAFPTASGTLDLYEWTETKAELEGVDTLVANDTPSTGLSPLQKAAGLGIIAAGLIVLVGVLVNE